MLFTLDSGRRFLWTLANIATSIGFDIEHSIKIDRSQQTVNKAMFIFTDASFCRKMASKLDIVH